METQQLHRGRLIERPYHPGYCAAFVIYPDGYNIEAVFNREARYSASSMTVDF